MASGMENGSNGIMEKTGARMIGWLAWSKGEEISPLFIDSRHISIGFLPVALLGIDRALGIGLPLCPLADSRSKTSRKNVTPRSPGRLSAPSPLSILPAHDRRIFHPLDRLAKSLDRVEVIPGGAVLAVIGVCSAAKRLDDAGSRFAVCTVSRYRPPPSSLVIEDGGIGRRISSRGKRD